MKRSKAVPAVIAIVLAVAAALVVYAVFMFSGSGGVPEGTFYFSSEKAGKFNDKLPSLSAKELTEYTPKHADCCSDFYKKTLDDKELCIYNAVLYAEDNEYTCVYFPSDCYDEEHPIEDTLSYVSCDSPFFEHNFTSDGNFYVASINFNAGGKLYYFELPHNTSEFSAEREQAYAAAKKIVEEMPEECDEDSEKAAYLYDKTAGGILYDRSADYSNDTVPIYDALVDEKHTTVCDGFADTLTLLYNLAGLPTFSVEGFNGDGVGHVVNVTELDGKYYYLDAASDASAWEQLGARSRFYYLMTDEMLNAYFVRSREFEGGLLPETGEYPAQYAADIAIAQLDDATVQKAVELLTENGCVLTAFSASLDKEAQTEFGRMLSLGVKESVNITRQNAIVAYTLKQDE